MMEFEDKVYTIVFQLTMVGLPNKITKLLRFFTTSFKMLNLKEF
jgi:hypothetical protein